MHSSEKMKIMHVTQAYGGVQTYILNIIENTHNDFDFGIVCGESTLSEIAEKSNIRIFKIPFVREPNLIKDLSSFFSIIVSIINYKPHIIHAHSAKGGFLGRIAGKLLGKKTIYTPNAFSYLGFTGYKRRLFLGLEQIGILFTDIILCVSPSEALRARTEVGYKHKQIIVIPNAISSQLIKPSKNSDIKKAVGMIGRLTFQKNPLFFVKIAKRMNELYPELKFYLLGEGYLDHLKNEVFDLIENYKLTNIEILKWGNSINSNKLLENLDILLLTSRYEGLPFTILEAMAKGIPVIATDVDGNRDVITNRKDGFLVEEDDVESACELILELYKNKQLRTIIGKNGKDKILDKFCIEKNITAIKEIYKNLK